LLALWLPHFHETDSILIKVAFMTESNTGSETPHEKPAAFRLLVFSNVDIQPLASSIANAPTDHDLTVAITTATCNQIKQLAPSAPPENKLTQPDAVLIWFWLPAFSPVLTAQFAQHPADKIKWEVERAKFTLSSMIKNIRANTTAPLLWMGFEPPAYPAYGIADSGIGQRHLIAELNAFVAQTLQQDGKACFIDTALGLERVGHDQFYTGNAGETASPFTEAAFRVVGKLLTKYVRALAGKLRKCLVLDCDNTLWGGIVGEDGVDAIRMRPDDGGHAFREFQRYVLNLYHRGMILAICSKNNEADVLEVFLKRKDMLLHEEHFAVIMANWNDKPSNLRAIATQLNISTDALVFVDDSPYEIESVKMALPEVAVLQVREDGPGGHARQLMDTSWFDALVITEEDRHRGEMYRADAKRNAFKDALTDIEEHFGAHFEIKTRFYTPEGTELDRAAQLCQRTNQFNLTTRRYSRTDLEQMLASGHQITALQVEDKFGDCGMVGLAVIRHDAVEGEILAFMMSCRALSRGIEAAFLKEILSKLPCKRITGCYIPTEKNSQTATFYPRNGFAPLRTEGASEWFIWQRPMSA
jgi:FkbH-like protein